VNNKIEQMNYLIIAAEGFINIKLTDDETDK
jgi:hypothetical protein